MKNFIEIWLKVISIVVLSVATFLTIGLLFKTDHPIIGAALFIIVTTLPIALYLSYEAGYEDRRKRFMEGRRYKIVY